MRKIFTDNTGHRWEYDEVLEGLEVYFLGGDNLSDSVTVPSEINGKTVVSIAQNAFYNSKFMKSVVIPDTIKYINPYAFEECTNLEEVKFGNSVESIGWGAFMNCKNLTEVNLPESVKYLRSEAFSGCKKMTSINIDKEVVTINQEVFAECHSLVNINVSPDNKRYSSIDGNLYDKDQRVLIQYAIGKEDESFTIPETVVKVGKNAIGGCSHLKQVITSYKFW